jgi:hypothetical protein
MFFYIYFDPAVVTIANADGPYAMQLLIATLRGFLQNCFVIDFEDYRLQTALRERIDALPATFDRKLVKSILVTMQKRNRFVCCLTPDYSGKKSEEESLLEQAAVALIDMALLESLPSPENAIPAGLEVATLATYQQTNFETVRSRLASDGRTTKPNEVAEVDFLEFHFHKGLRYATKIQLCDRLFGAKYADNYQYTIRRFFRWLESVLADPASCEIEIHTEQPRGIANRTIESEIRGEKVGNLAAVTIRMHYYDGSGLSDSLPHERFVLTDQVALSIDRGLDFLDRTTRMARDVFVTYKDGDECEAVLTYYAAKGSPKTAII